LVGQRGDGGRLRRRHIAVARGWESPGARAAPPRIQLDTRGPRGFLCLFGAFDFQRFSQLDKCRDRFFTSSPFCMFAYLICTRTTAPQCPC
jgi:hypothetical protein